MGDFYKSKYYKQKRRNQKLKKELKDKDLIINQYKILYDEAKSALKIAKKNIPTNAEDLSKL